MKRISKPPTFFHQEDFSKESFLKKQKLKRDEESFYNSIECPIFKKNKKLESIFVDKNETPEKIWEHFIFRNKGNYEYIIDIKERIENDQLVSGTFRIYAKCCDFSFKIPTDPMHFFLVFSTKDHDILFNHYAKGYEIINFYDDYGLKNNSYTFIDNDFYIEIVKGESLKLSLSELICDTLRFSFKYDKGNNNSVYPGTCSGLSLSIARYLGDKDLNLGQSSISKLAIDKIKEL
jgi:hypothetical protein